MKITLTKPVGLNRLYGTNKYGAKYLKAEGRAWKEQAAWVLKATPVKYDGEIRFWVDLYTCRKQDNDSILKLLQDTFQYSGMIKDDYQIFDLRVIKHIVPIKEEKVVIDIESLSHQLRGGE